MCSLHDVPVADDTDNKVALSWFEWGDETVNVSEEDCCGHLIKTATYSDFL